MSQEQFNLNWHTFSDHLKEMMLKLMESNETADVTLVCEDKAKFRAHKFVLMSCSPVFHSIINDLPKTGGSFIYLRGVLAQEMKSILQFIYLGQATLYRNRMNEFLNVAKILEIKEISKDVDCDEEAASESDVTDDDILKNNENLYTWETKNQISEMVAEELELETKITQSSRNETGKFQCSECDKQFVSKSNVNLHIQRAHEGLNFQCNECDKTFNQKIHLITHIKGVHEGIKFPCNECPYKATKQSNLVQHKKIKH